MHTTQFTLAWNVAGIIGLGGFCAQQTATKKLISKIFIINIFVLLSWSLHRFFTVTWSAPLILIIRTGASVVEKFLRLPRLFTCSQCILTLCEIYLSKGHHIPGPMMPWMLHFSQQIVLVTRRPQSCFTEPTIIICNSQPN